MPVYRWRRSYITVRERGVRDTEEKISVCDNDLEKVSGGTRIVTEDVLTYIRFLRECPGVIDRVMMNEVTEQDDEIILKYFPNIDRFIFVASFCYGKPVDQLMQEVQG